MAFVLKQSDSYRWPVSFKLPTDGGKREKQTFEAEFKRLPQSRITQIQAEVQKLMKAVEAGEQPDGISDISVAQEVLVGWSGVVDEDGEEVPFSKTSCDALLDLPTVAASIIQCYFESLVDSKTKN